MLVLKLQRPQNSCMQRNQDFADRAFVTECILLHENAYTREHTWSSIREDHVYVCVFLCVCVFRRCMRVVHVQGSVYIRRQNTVAPAHFRFVAVYLKNGKPHRSVAGLIFLFAFCATVLRAVYHELEEKSIVRWYSIRFTDGDLDWTVWSGEMRVVLRKKLLEICGNFKEYW